MKLHALDITIIVIYLVAMLTIGVIMVRRASKNLDSYFPAENLLPWWILGVSNASAMFDVTGRMWLVIYWSAADCAASSRPSKPPWRIKYETNGI